MTPTNWRRARKRFRAKRCHYCDVALTKKTATIDHIVPRVAGGAEGRRNQVLACFDCNQRKGAQAYDEFIRDRERLGLSLPPS